MLNTLNNSSIEETPTIIKPAIDTDILVSIATDLQTDSFIYVHCYFENLGEDMLIRIWKSTFLVDSTSSSKAKLVHVENISLAPQWTIIPGGVMFHFLLIFTSLPTSCSQFDLIEDIPQPGGFVVKNIPRNERDVYHIDV